MPLITATPRIPRAARARRHATTWRTAAAIPAIIGSAAIILGISSLLGPAWPAGPVLWLLLGLATLTRAGERFTVRAIAGYQPLTPQQAAAIEPAWREACARAGIDDDAVDLYLIRANSINASAIGGRSIALTTAAIQANVAPGTAHGHTVVLLLHELGHHDGRATRYSLATTVLAAPWRYIARAITAVMIRIASPGLLTLILAGIVMTIAVVQTAQRGHPEIAAFIAFLAIAGIGCPLLDAAAGRRTEYAADAYAAQRTSTADVIATLRTLPATALPRAPLARALQQHPTQSQRVAALTID